MAHPDSYPEKDTEELLISDDILVALVLALQNLSQYGEYARNDRAVFGNINPFKTNIVFTPNMPITERPTHQDSGEMLVRDETYPDEIMVYKMKVWTPYEGASTRPFTLGGKDDSISYLWHDRIVGGSDSDFILATTAGRRAYQMYHEFPSEDLQVYELDDDTTEKYIDEINVHIESLEAEFPEVPKLKKEIE